MLQGEIACVADLNMKCSVNLKSLNSASSDKLYSPCIESTVELYALIKANLSNVAPTYTYRSPVDWYLYGITLQCTILSLVFWENTTYIIFYFG